MRPFIYDQEGTSPLAWWTLHYFLRYGVDTIGWVARN